MVAKLAIALVLFGCAGARIRDLHEGKHKLTFHNEGGGPVCGIYIFPFGRSDQGANWLPPDTEVAQGRSIELWVAPETYQFRATGCPYERQHVSGYVASVIMNTPGIVVLFDEALARSKDAAVALAHRHENSTLVPAKYKLVASPAQRPATQRAAPPSRTDR
jgi:hypothetical protein